MCAPVRSLRGCGRAKREPADAEPTGLKWLGTVECAASRGPPVPAPDMRPGHLMDGHGSRHHRSPPPRNAPQTTRGRAKADRPELGLQRGSGSCDELLLHKPRPKIQSFVKTENLRQCLPLLHTYPI